MQVGLAFCIAHCSTIALHGCSRAFLCQLHTKGGPAWWAALGGTLLHNTVHADTCDGNAAGAVAVWAQATSSGSILVTFGTAGTFSVICSGAYWLAGWTEQTLHCCESSRNPEHMLQPVY